MPRMPLMNTSTMEKPLPSYLITQLLFDVSLMCLVTLDTWLMKKISSWKKDVQVIRAMSLTCIAGSRFVITPNYEHKCALGQRLATCRNHIYTSGKVAVQGEPLSLFFGGLSIYKCPIGHSRHPNGLHQKVNVNQINNLTSVTRDVVTSACEGMVDPSCCNFVYWLTHWADFEHGSLSDGRHPHGRHLGGREAVQIEENEELNCEVAERAVARKQSLHEKGTLFVIQKSATFSPPPRSWPFQLFIAEIIF